MYTIYSKYKYCMLTQVYICMLFCNIYVLKLKFIMQDPTEKHFGDVGILDKYKYKVALHPNVPYFIIQSFWKIWRFKLMSGDWEVSLELRRVGLFGFSTDYVQSCNSSWYSRA
jgi:hypothetical protein